MRTPKLDEPVCVTLHAARRWVGRCLGSTEHETRVSAIGAMLFDLTAPLHNLGGQHRRLLRLAATVHDVGRAVDEDTHPVEGARMILANGDLPLAGIERRRLAYLTRYHRGAVPAAGRDGILRRSDDHYSLLHVLALLRAADALDGRAIAPPHLSFTLAGRRLRIRCRLAEDCAKARDLYRRRKKFRMLEDLLGFRFDFDVDVATAGRLQPVA